MQKRINEAQDEQKRFSPLQATADSIENWQRTLT